MFRRFLVAAVVSLALVSNSTAVWPAAAATNAAVGTHKLIVVVTKTLSPAAEKKLAVLVLISENGGAPAGAVDNAEQAPHRSSKQQRPLPGEGRDRLLLRGRLCCELSNFRVGQSQARDHPQLSAQGLTLRLQQGDDREGLLSTGPTLGRI